MFELLLLIHCISQNSLMACLRCGKKYNKGLNAKLLPSPSMKDLKISQHLPKLCLGLEWHVYLTHNVLLTLLLYD